uniref:Uncharacterized protein n=1 Tax=Oryza nivara TaxID=4536 RepID=A0A0E0H8U0_ORYNI
MVGTSGTRTDTLPATSPQSLERNVASRSVVPEHLLLRVEDMDDVRRLDGADQDLLLCIEDDVVATTTAGDGAWADDLEERAANLGELGQFGLIKPHSNEIELKMGRVLLGFCKFFG